MAANPVFDVAAAYQFLYMDGDEDGQSFPFGVAIDAARYWGALALAAEGGWAYDSTEFDDRSVFARLSAKTNFFHASAGPRFALRSPARVRPYAQVLFGVSTVRLSIGDLDGSHSETAFMIQPGGGANFVMGTGWSLFGDVAYRRSFFENQIRFLVGARMILD